MLLTPVGHGVQCQRAVEDFPHKALRWRVLNRNEEEGKKKRQQVYCTFSVRLYGLFCLTSAFQSIKTVLNLQQILEM